MDILSSETPQDKRICPKCGKSKFRSQFYRNNDWCRVCVVAHGKNTEGIPEGHKRCTKCKNVRPFSAFRPRYKSTGLSSWCGFCTHHWATEKRHATYQTAEARDKHLRNCYGVTLAEYNEKLAEQKELCAICGEKETLVLFGLPMNLVVDHCHTTGAFRGLLCNACNQALGLMGEDPARVKALLRYIEERCLW